MKRLFEKIAHLSNVTGGLKFCPILGFDYLKT
jgi:hypothetical protein